MDKTPVKLQTSPYSLSPLSHSSQRLLRSPHKATRKISRIPFKVLDAPELQDDFYLNLVDWSAQNVLSVGLGNCVYLWSACTSQVTRLCRRVKLSETAVCVISIMSPIGWRTIWTNIILVWGTSMIVLMVSIAWATNTTERTTMGIGGIGRNRFVFLL